MVGSAAGADVAGAGGVGCATRVGAEADRVPVGWVVVTLGLPEAEAVDIGVAVVVMAVAGELSPVDAASRQPAAIPITREAPTITRIALRPPRSNRMPTPICPIRA